jgi:hypothetical protein
MKNGAQHQRADLLDNRSGSDYILPAIHVTLHFTSSVSRSIDGMKREFRSIRKLPRNCQWQFSRWSLFHRSPEREGPASFNAMSQETCRTEKALHLRGKVRSQRRDFRP